MRVAILQALVATVDSIDAFTLLHAMAPMSFDASRLIDMACIAFSGRTMDQIQALRKAYRTTVVASKHVRSPLPNGGGDELCCTRKQLCLVTGTGTAAGTGTGTMADAKDKAVDLIDPIP